MHATGLNTVESWFARHGWQPFPFQRAVWQAYLGGEDGLIHAPTGTGKTYAAWFGPVIAWLNARSEASRPAGTAAPPLRILWLTPMRALAADTEPIDPAPRGRRLA